jgi:hypothetical protein
MKTIPYLLGMAIVGGLWTFTVIAAIHFIVKFW